MKTILLVDDNETILWPMTVALRQAGFEVQGAREGGAALKLVGQQYFDLVITDLVMPGKEGLETIMELRRLEPGLKIIAMSGDGSQDPGGYLHMARQLGATATLTKPFSGEEMLEVVARVLGEP